MVRRAWSPAEAREQDRQARRHGHQVLSDEGTGGRDAPSDHGKRTEREHE